MTETEFDAKLRAAIDWVVITAAVAIGIIYVLLGGILFRWWEIPPWGLGVALGFQISGYFALRRRGRSPKEAKDDEDDEAD